MSSLDTASTHQDERELVAALRAGDEEAFRALIDQHSPAMLRVARSYVRGRAVAEEVVQDAWLAVVEGIDRFEGRASLRTWIFRILTNTASTRAKRERRSVPLSSLGDPDDSERGPVVDPDRFLPEDHAFAGHWAIGPAPWPTPEEGLLADEARRVIISSVERLSPTQRSVVALRDIYGWPAADVCDALGISEVNQRVLLHRGRSRVRGALERHYGSFEATLPEVAT